MKNRITSLFIGCCLVALLCGCGRISNEQIVIKRYKGLKVEAVELATVTDEDVEERIQWEILSLGTKVAIRERAVKEGDTVYVDYVGTVDGVEFYGGSAEDYVLELGSKSFFIQGFENSIIGHKPGATFELHLKFPEEYSANPSLAGQPVVFNVTLDGIVPYLTEGLVSKLSESAETIEEYKEEVREDLEASAEKEAQKDLEQKVWDALIKNCEVKEYPKDKVKEYTEELQSQYQAYASMYDMEVEDVVEKEYGIPLIQVVRNKICKELAMELIAEEENIQQEEVIDFLIANSK